MSTAIRPARPHRRLRWTALAGAGALIAGLTVTHLTGVDAAGDDPLSYNATAPCRLIDTRPDPLFNVGPRTTPLGPAETITLDAQGAQGQCTAEQLPTTADALALNVTVVSATANGFLTFWPDGDRPNASSLNPAPGQPPAPNAVTTLKSDAGTFNVFNNAGFTHLIIDVVGNYTPTTTGGGTASGTVYTRSEVDDLIAGHHHDNRYYTEAESNQFRTNITDRVSALESGGSSEGRTTFVGGDGASGTIGNDLADAITAAAGRSPTAAEPWIIRLDAGSYTVGELTLPAHVHLRGSGPGVSILTGRVNATGDTSVSSLTIDNPGVNTFRSITTSSALLLDQVEVIGDSGLAVGSGADVDVTNSDFVVGNGPIVVPVSAPAGADVSISGSRLTNTWAGGPAVSVDGGTLGLYDVTGSFGFNGVEADTVSIDRSRLVANGQFQVTNAGTMTVTNSYLERSPATTFRVISVVGVGSELTVVDSAVMGGGGGNDDAVGATESCIAVAHDLGFEDTGCP